MEKTPYIPASATSLFPPVGVPVGSVRASCAAFLAAFDHLLAKPHPGPIFRANDSLTFKLSTSKDQKAAEIVLIEVLDRVQQIAVEGQVRPLRVARRA